MIAKEFISDIIVPLRTSSTAMEALNWMDEYRVSHLPIVNEATLLGTISENDIYAYNHYEDSIGSHPLSLANPYVYDYQHVFDVLKIMSEHKLTLLPVLDQRDHYIGSVIAEQLLHKFPANASLLNPGGVIVLERNVNDYSMAEIAQIVESNDAKIIAVFISANPDSTKLDVSLKINRMDIAPILQTFIRYNYTIKASFGEDSYQDILRDRYDLLMTYLNI